MAEPKLLDYMGREIDMGALRQEHAGPSVVGVRSILTTHPASRITPQRLGRILREAETPGAGSSEEYVELAEDMEERDLHYLGVLNTRKRQVAQIGVMVEPASDKADDVRDAEFVQSFFERDGFEDELTDILDAVGKGYSAAEIDWDTSERQWMPRRLVWRLPQWFDFDRDSGERLLLRQDDGWGELPAYKFVVHIAKVKSGIPIRGGLARAIAWGWLFKNYTLKDWARFVEAYGHPIRLGKFPPNSDPADKAVLYRAVRNVAADAAAIIPEGMDIEFVDDTTVRGRAEIFDRFVAYIDSRISIAVLGQTLTTEQGDRGSQSLGNVHNLVRGDIERSDARQLAATLRRDLVIPMIALNHGPRETYPRIRIERETTTDLEQLTSSVKELVPLGLPVRVDEVLARLGLKKPGDNDDVLRPAASGPADHPDDDDDTPRSTSLARATNSADDDELEQVMEAIDADAWRTLAAPLIEPILERAQGDPETFLDDLAAIYPDLDADALTERLARVIFVADVWGRLQSTRS